METMNTVKLKIAVIAVTLFSNSLMGSDIHITEITGDHEGGRTSLSVRAYRHGVEKPISSQSEEDIKSNSSALLNFSLNDIDYLKVDWTYMQRSGWPTVFEEIDMQDNPTAVQLKLIGKSISVTKFYNQT